jgi:SHS2 domain-containing protein
MSLRDDGGTPHGGVREIDHSGDVALEIWGATRSELLANATRGLCGLMTWSAVESVRTRRIEVRASSLPDLLVDWLSAVILAAATHAELYGHATVETAEDGFAAGLLHGAPLDPARHALRFDVKAATYHEVRFEHTAYGYHARVVFDL